MVDDGYRDSSLPARQQAAVAFADAFLNAAGPPSAEDRALIGAELEADEIAELGVGMALFHGFAKLLISLGCEPSEMDTTVLATPGSR